jgi:hypothetical protein
MVRLTTGIVTLVLLAASIAGFAVQPPDAHFSEPQVRPSQVFRIEPVAPPPIQSAPPLIRFPVATVRAIPVPEVTIVAEAPPAPEATVPPPFIAGDGPWMRGTRVAQTGRVDVYVGLRTFTAEQVRVIAPRLEELLRGNEERFGFQLNRRVSLAFYRPALAPSKIRAALRTPKKGALRFFTAPTRTSNARWWLRRTNLLTTSRRSVTETTHKSEPISFFWKGLRPGSPVLPG